MTLESEVTAVATDDAVGFELVVRNAGDDPVEVTFRSGQDADFVVLDGDDEVWRASDDQLFTQALRPATFDPGTEQTYRGKWSDPEPGEYTVVATLAVTEEDVQEQVEARTDLAYRSSS
jgi:hypothetical protein